MIPFFLSKSCKITKNNFAFLFRNHNDFVYAVEARELVYDKIIDQMKNFVLGYQKLRNYTIALD